MDVIKNPHPSEVLPLFRALHLFHVSVAPQMYHAEGADSEYITHLEEAYAKGATIYAVEGGWGLVAYLLALPEQRAQDALRRGHNRMRIDHLYVAPTHRGKALGRRLVAALEADMHRLGISDWVVTWHASNLEAGLAYERLGGTASLVISAKANV